MLLPFIFYFWRSRRRHIFKVLDGLLRVEIEKHTYMYNEYGLPDIWFPEDIKSDLQKDLLMYPEKELDTIEEEDGTSSNELGLSMTQLGIAQK